MAEADEEVQADERQREREREREAAGSLMSDGNGQHHHEVYECDGYHCGSCGMSGEDDDEEGELFRQR